MLLVQPVKSRPYLAQWFHSELMRIDCRDFRSGWHDLVAYVLFELRGRDALVELVSGFAVDILGHQLGVDVILASNRDLICELHRQGHLVGLSFTGLWL